MTLSKKLLNDQTPKEEEATKKSLENLIYNSMTLTEKLRSKLRNHIAQLNTTPNKIKERQFENPFPIGTRSVYVFASGGKISDSAKWKLLEFFERIK